MRKPYIIVTLYFLLSACSNLDGVKPASTSVSIFFYGGNGNYTATSAIELADGFLLVGDSVAVDNYGIVVIRTDIVGKTVWRKIINGAISSAVLSTADGYLIVGDSIKVDLKQTTVIDQVKRKLRLIAMNSSGLIVKDKYWGDPANSRTDLHGTSITIDPQGNIISTSIIKPPGVYSYTQASMHNPSTLEIQWSKFYNQDTKDYQNSKSVFVNKQGNIIWATSAVATTATASRSFLRVPVLVPNVTFSNDAVFGQNEQDSYHSGNDIKPNAVGYGIIGTYRTFTGDKSNVFFIRTDPAGNPVAGSEQYFDGITTANDKKSLSDKTISETQDEGLALTSTRDGGFVLAGYTTSSINGAWGNGGKDIYLIRIDPFGNVLWTKTLGGTGDEVPASITQTADEGFLISGTLTLAGQSSIFLIKTNSKGELKN